ncbi:MAG: hypothetical protein FWB98_06025 [Defluviitaleaceae bacterium]|nr:hypothetical protein [Defluviitaleaceae bacterium]
MKPLLHPVGAYIVRLLSDRRNLNEEYVCLAAGVQCTPLRDDAEIKWVMN